MGDFLCHYSSVLFLPLQGEVDVYLDHTSLLQIGCPGSESSVRLINQFEGTPAMMYSMSVDQVIDGISSVSCRCKAFPLDLEDFVYLPACPRLSLRRYCGAYMQVHEVQYIACRVLHHP